MRFRLGILAGFGLGYYLGARAGRARYEQIRRALDHVQPLAKATALVELGVERVRSSGAGGDRSAPPGDGSDTDGVTIR